MHRSTRLALIALSLTLAVGAATALGGCAKSAAKDSSSAPTSPAPAEATASTAPATLPTIEIVTPAGGSTVAAGDVSVAVKTTGLKFTMPSNNLVAGEGHVHFTLDTKPFEMSVSPEYVFKGVAAGEHKLVAELVQNDTQSFSPKVEQEITFVAK